MCILIYYFVLKVTFLTFFTFVISDQDNILTAEKIFVSMSLFYTMHLPLGLLPLIVVSAIEVEPPIYTTIYLHKRLWYFLAGFTNTHTHLMFFKIYDKAHD